MFNFNNYELHYENVYSSLELAKQVGEIWLENELRKEYEDWFEEDTNADVKRKELYQGLYGLKRAVDALKGSHKNLNIEAIEMEINRLCHILSN